MKHLSILFNIVALLFLSVDALGQENFGMSYIKRFSSSWGGIYPQATTDGDRLFVATNDRNDYLLNEGYLVFHVLTYNPPNPPVEEESFVIDGIRDFRQCRVQDDCLYVSTTDGLKIFDLNDMVYPTLMASFARMDGISAFELDGDFAYAVAGNSLLLTIDISNPGNPRQVNSRQLPHTVTEMRVDNSYLYAGGSALSVYDLFHPDNPAYTSTYEIESVDLEIMGNTLALGRSFDGIELLDISEPEELVVVAHIDDIAKQLEIVNGYLLSAYRLFEANEDWDRDAVSYAVYDISQPENPCQVGNRHFIHQNSRVYLFRAVGNAIALANTVDGYNGGVHFQSIDDLGRVGDDHRFLPMSIWYNAINCVNDNLLYSICDNGDSVIFSISDVSDLENTQELSSMRLNLEPMRMAVSNNRVFIYDRESGFLRMMLADDPTQPRLCNLVYQFPRSTYCYNLNIYDDYAYIPNSNGVTILPIEFDVSPEGAFLSTDSYLTPDFVVVGDYGYMPARTNGLFIFDLHDRDQPWIVGQMEVRGDALSADSENGLLYVANGDLEVYNLDTPEQPELIHIWETPDSVIKVRVLDGYAYLISGKMVDINTNIGRALIVLDISDPDNPREKGYFHSRNRPNDLMPVPPYLWVATNLDLSVFDCAEALCAPNDIFPDTPAVFLLEPAYPNPFNASSNVSFSLPVAGCVSVFLWDATGRLVGKPVPTTTMQAGHHRYRLNANQLPTGVYLIQVQYGDQSQITSVTLTK